MSSFADQRRNMVDGQLRTFDVFDRAVLAAMYELPREAFVPPGLEHLAYLDRNIVFGAGPSDVRVMLAPMVLGRLVQAADVDSGSRVLDVGGAYGYSSAVFASMGAKVTLLEPAADLAEAAGGNLAAAGLDVTVRAEPLERGSAGDGPFDIILVNGAVETRPATLLDQLADGGRLACLMSGPGAGKAVLFLRSGAAFGERRLFDAAAPVLAPFRNEPAFQF